MALFGKSEEQQEYLSLYAENVQLKAKLESATERVEDCKAQIEKLEAQVERLQDALVSKEAPQAYSDRATAEEEVSLTPEQRAELERTHRIAVMNRHLLDEMESPLFRDADDMMSMLGGGMQPPTSMHGNDES